MEITTTGLEGLLVLRPRIFRDERGHFLETFNGRQFHEAVGELPRFVQDNESFSKAHVLRGLHFQVEPHAQGKLVRVLHGAVLDVVVDIREGSATYGRHFKQLLDDREKLMMWIPPGFAHGFLALEDDTVFAYKCTAYYHQPSERTILWNDPDLGIDWGIDAPIISAKDHEGQPFRSGAWKETAP